jgi:hypothetical protein
MQTDAHGRLELLTDGPIGKRALWGKIPHL